MKMAISRIGAALMALALVATLRAEDAAPEADTKSPAEQFAAAQEEWKQFEKQLEKDLPALRAAYKSADVEGRKKIEKEYNGIVAKGPAILQQMRTGALALYTESPNKDEEVTKALVRLLAD